MQVIATAGHVDHGKSTLIHALTGMQPDRWAAERRRGLTIDLGFAWTRMPSGATVAFVDVPGHARFVANMLAGVGPVPATLFVVAADEGWMPQSTEHLDALAALGVSDGVLVITRCDRADPAAALAAARDRLAGTPLAGMPAVPVTAPTGDGLDRLRAALDALAGRLPVPDPRADVRLWIDRAFAVRGAGTVVTGTLTAGTVRVGDRLLLGERTVRVRGLHTLGEPVEAASGVARVALNLRGAEPELAGRGRVLLTPGAWRSTDTTDVRLVRAVDRLPRELRVHVGAAAVPARLRRLGADAGRLWLATPLPLRIGDRVLLRDPGAHRVLAGGLVLDVAPPPLARRPSGDAVRPACRAEQLAGMSDRADLADELRRRGLARADRLRAMGVRVDRAPVAGDWLADPAHWARLRDRLHDLVERHRAAEPLSAGLPVDAARHRLGLPDAALVAALADGRLGLADGRLLPAGAGDRLPGPVARAVAAVRDGLADTPWSAPDADRLAELGLGRAELAAAVRAGALLELAPGVVLAPGADTAAVRVLAALPQPFTLSQARQALGTSRRVAVPLLERLARAGHTQRLADSRHRLRPAARP